MIPTKKDNRQARMENSILHMTFRSIFREQVGSLLSLLVALFTFIGSAILISLIVPSDWLQNSLIVLAVGVLGAIMAIASYFRETRIKSQLEELSHIRVNLLDQYRSSYELLHKHNSRYRNQITTEMWNYLSELALPIDGSELKIHESAMLDTIINTKAALKTYYRARGIDIADDLSLNVKLIVDGHQIADFYQDKLSPVQKERIIDNKWVVTVARDPETYAKYAGAREVGRVVYDLKLNTALETIAHHGSAFFLSNDLQDSSGYLNENPNWAKWYNAILVVPIKLTGHVVGFFSADSNRRDIPELFDTTACHIMAYSSELITNHLLMETFLPAIEKMSSVEKTNAFTTSSAAETADLP